MKKLTLIFRMFLFAALMATWTSCGVESVIDNPVDDPYMIVCEHVADVAEAVDVHFDQSKSIEELSQYLDEIKKIPYVEDAYTTSTTLYVKIKDYGMLHYSIFPEPELDSFDVDELLNKTRRKAPSNDLIEHPYLEPKRVCIVNAQYMEFLVENDKIDRKNIAEITKLIFETLNYKADLINAPNLYFYSDVMYNYDIVFLIAHGNYDSDKDLHWIIGIGSDVENLKPEEIYKNKGYSEDQVAFSKYKYTGELFASDRTVGWNVSISEKFIEDTPGEVNEEKKGMPIFFSVPCQSLKGNDNMGQAFLDKGFGAYYGYTHNNYWGQRAYFHMLNNMLSGMSIESAYNALPEYYRDESKATWLVEQKTKEKKYDEIPKAKLESLPRNGKADIYKTCIVKPIVYELKSVPTGSEIQIQLTGMSFFWSLYYDINNPNRFSQHPNTLRYGFFISETSDFRNASQVCAITSTDENNYDYNNYIVSFHYNINYEPSSSQNLIVPGKDYYVWSYIFDGKEYYLSNMKNFTIHVNTSGGVISDVPGTDF